MLSHCLKKKIKLFSISQNTKEEHNQRNMEGSQGREGHNYVDIYTALNLSLLLGEVAQNGTIWRRKKTKERMKS